MGKKRISSSNLLAKECIVSALLQLLKHQTISAVTVTELCNRAGVSRMTFYRNYSSIEDIFIKHLNEIFENYKQDDETRKSTGIFCDKRHMEHYFDYLYKYREFLDVIIQCGYDVMFLKKLNNYILEKWALISDKFMLTAFSGALYNTFLLWSESKYTEDKEQLINNLVKIFEPNIKSNITGKTFDDSSFHANN